MLIVHHLGKSQSERVVWLCEEIGLPYELRRHQRDAKTILAPPELLAVFPTGTAPIIEDDGVVLAESPAIFEYLFAKHGDGGLARQYGQDSFAPYLFWFHFANGNIQPSLSRLGLLGRSKVAEDNPAMAFVRDRARRALLLLDARVTEHEWLAGDGFSAADIMNVFSLTTMRYFAPVEMGEYAGILAYLQRVAARPGYRRAMAKGDPGMELLLT